MLRFQIGNDKVLFLDHKTLQQRKKDDSMKFPYKYANNIIAWETWSRKVLIYRMYLAECTSNELGQFIKFDPEIYGFMENDFLE